MTLDDWITGHQGEDQLEDEPRCPNCDGEADEKEPEGPCWDCKVANWERVNEGDR